MDSIKEKVEKEVEKIRKAYIDSVHRLNSDNGTAESFSKDYDGRQICELLKNAEEQVKSGNGAVKIVLSGNKLTVYNTGEPFSAKGFISILYVCDSPKEHLTEKTIGYKGIGFRSVLNWTDEIKITSAGLTLEFSENIAEETYNSILSQVENREEYEHDYKKTYNCKVPVLVCPKINSAPSKLDGYDTVIEFTCFDTVIANVKEQINELKPEVLLFLKKIKTIELEIDDEKRKFIKDDIGNSKKILTVDYCGTKENDVYEYDFFTEEGEFEDKYYEISIGYDRKRKTSGEVLYSYFKTNVEISFPAFIHATFELTSNRNELLSNNNYNEELTKKLASKLAETAVKISQLDIEEEQATYEPLKLLLTNSIDFSLRQYNFEELINDAIKISPVFPTIKNTYISLKDDPFYSETRFDQILYPGTFSTLLKKSEDITIQRYIISEAKLDFYDNDQFRSLLNTDIAASRYSCEQKCKLIKLIIHSPNICGKGITLLEDLDGNIISSDDNVYVQPSATDRFTAPNWPWLKVKFLNEEMRQILLAGIEQSSIDSTFRDFKLVRYRFNTLIGKIISDLNKNKTRDNVYDVLKWLFNFYCTPKSETEETGERDLGTTKIPVICRENKISLANEAYFGSEYGNKIGEKIISSYDKEHFLFYDLFGSSDRQMVIGFYEWIGVAHFPRIVEYSIEDSKEKERYSNFNFYSLNREYLGEYSKNIFFHYYILSLKVFFFEHFEEIVQSVDFYEIICWFLSDKTAKEYIDSPYEVNKQSIMKYKGQRERIERNIYSDSLASFARFFLTTKNWIQIDGNFFDAGHCCLEEIKLKGVIESPKIDIENIKKYCPSVSISEVNGLLGKIGISESFSDLKTDVKYELLLKLPELDKECKYGKSIYNKMKGTANRVLMEGGPNYHKFISEGKVLVSINDEKKYVSVKEAKYTPNKLYGEKILKELPMLVYDYRQGRVKDLFGVELLGDIHPTISDEIINPEVNKQFASNFEEFKVYVLAYRLIASGAGTDSLKLKRLNIILANSIKVNFPIDDDVRSVQLGNYETVYLNGSDGEKNSIAYIKIPDNCYLYTEIENNPYFADAVAEIVSTVLNLSGDLTFFSSLFSSSHERRKNILINTRGEEILDFIEKAKEKLKVVFDNKQEFWISVANAKKNHLQDNATVIDIIDSLGIANDWENKFNYDKINSLENIPYLIDLFNILNIDVDEYNRQTSDKIDITEYYQRKFNNLKTELQEKYLIYIFNKYKTEKNFEQFEKDKYNYTSFRINIKNSVKESIEVKFEEAFGVTCSELRSIKGDSVDNIKEEKKKNYQDYSKLLKKYTPERLDLYLLFDCLDKLVTEDEDKDPTKEKPKKSLKEMVSDAKKLADQPDYFPNVQTEKVDVSIKHQGGKRGHIFASGGKIGSINDAKEEIGLAGEIAVYNVLSKNYSKVEWLSENAVKYGSLLHGDDSLGYDMAYINEDNERMMVEVKATIGNQIEFELSNNELSVALEDPNHYEIFFVFINHNSKSKILNLGKLFKFDNENESPFSNSKFTILYDKYIIRAKEKSQ